MSTITFAVTVASGKYLIDGSGPSTKLTFRDGDTYIFDQSHSSNSGHILKFSATSDNSGSSVYSTGVTISGTSGQAGAKTTIITSASTTDTLYYYCANHSGMGSEFSNTGFVTSTGYNILKPKVGDESSLEKWGPIVNHSFDQIDQAITSVNAGGVAMAIALG